MPPPVRDEAPVTFSTAGAFVYDPDSAIDPALTIWPRIVSDWPSWIVSAPGKVRPWLVPSSTESVLTTNRPEPIVASVPFCSVAPSSTISSLSATIVPASVGLLYWLMTPFSVSPSVATPAWWLAVSVP